MEHLEVGMILKDKRGLTYFPINILEVGPKIVAYNIEGIDGSGIMWITRERLDKLYIIPKKKWVPKEYETFYLINSIGDVRSYNYSSLHIKYSDIGNCFPTECRAREVAAKIKELLSTNF